MSTANKLVELAEKAKEKGGVKLYKKNIEMVLSGLLITGNFWSIVDYADLPVPAAAGIVNTLLEEGYAFVDQNQDIRLTQKGYDLIKEYNIHPRKEYRCQACEGRGIPFYLDIELYRAFLQETKNRPKAIQDYDQGSVTPETTVSRVLFIDSRGDLQGKDIVVMGAEDDLTGLAIALSRKANSVTIIDIDKRSIDFDNEIFERLGIKNAKAFVWDLRKPLPEEMLGKFDVFITDPPETIAAFSAFIKRGISLLKDEGAVGYFGLTLRDSSIYRWREFQKILTGEIGVAITDIIQDFNNYITWDYHKETKAYELAPVKKDPEGIWYRSAWYRIEALPGFSRWNGVISDEDLYLDEEGSTT
ncbi:MULTISPECIES: bis-aminopropyl spermidine synthase family protein [unclassified Hydrogenobaculum]|uniref:bis-aminopropyl spermidine synthase family protein n=1 Tax=unclassified Hydrogenobaculum TaxID=2622382 RepID=UPI0001C50732|nr:MULTISPECIES: bis-aminopropyl spermidine synthase family protein [unclassified Hydrogenobaculum]AEF19216.1 protein of unknown function DUF43 [Hydrogenobaculum sp. 3684]AEG46505.1 protein of unknown function DUF43 [Hydrogenobaculum sp. SHO]AGG15149.1 putative methyltransferase [Hydrogenobaculum sp. HO]AGH93447.1 putative methyltransferase [Hydrogenobaculum sp. SN]